MFPPSLRNDAVFPFLKTFFFAGSPFALLAALVALAALTRADWVAPHEDGGALGAAICASADADNWHFAHPSQCNRFIKCDVANGRSSIITCQPGCCGTTTSTSATGLPTSSAEPARPPPPLADQPPPPAAGQPPPHLADHPPPPPPQSPATGTRSAAHTTRTATTCPTPATAPSSTSATGPFGLPTNSTAPLDSSSTPPFKSVIGLRNLLFRHVLLLLRCSQ